MRILTIPATLLALAFALPVGAATEAPGAATKLIQTVDRELAQQRWPNDLATAWDALDDARRKVKRCVADAEGELAILKESATALGEPAADEARETRTLRQSIERQRRDEEQVHALCKSLELTVVKILDRIEAEREQRRRRDLGTRFPSVIDVLAGKLAVDVEPRVLISQLSLLRFGWGQEPAAHLLVLALLSLVAYAAGNRLRRRLVHAAEQRGESGFTSRLTQSALTSAAHYAPTLAVLPAWCGYWAVASWRLDVPLTMLGISIVLFGFVLYRAAVAMFLLPRRPASHFLALDESQTRRLGRQLLRTGWLPLALLLLYLVPLDKPLSEGMLALIRMGAVTLLVVVLGGLAQRIPRKGEHPRGRWRLRMLAWASLIAVWILELLGYRNLSEYMLAGLLGTLLLAGMGWFVASVWADAMDSMDEGRYGWQQRLRQQLEVPEDKGLPGMVWLRLVGSIAIWLAVGWGLLGIWGATAAQKTTLANYVAEGFTVGSIEIVPMRIALALILFTIIASLVGWFRRQLDQRWLGRARIDLGAKNALVTLFGYLGIALGLLFALGFAGVDFSSLAIVAGALSVGIGFGLQNVVNNFVSGLILLFERPIRNGDWIVVGDTEGYVEKISIRSTVIRTFDRSEVIVPNSELISNQVTNWMLRDRLGRVRLPIGVAYGSNVEKVRDILLGIAENHPDRARNRDVVPPRAYFLGFGDSSLDFELRFFVRNVDLRMQVISDCNFRIYNALNAAGIEIPFPQRVVHMPQSPATGTPAADAAGD